MRGRLPLLLLVLGVLFLASLTPIAYAKRLPGPVILVDLVHTDNYGGLCLLFRIMPEAYWYVLMPKGATLPPEIQKCVNKYAYKILYGSFADNERYLRDVDMIIIGQPTKMISDADAKVIAKWFNEKGKSRALWCAGDSDYPAQGGKLEIADRACDKVLSAMGVKLRLDFVSVEDTASNAGAPYRVVALVKPDNRYNASMIAFGADKVLMHGPGAVAWVDSSGRWHKLTDPNTPKNLIKILVTTKNGRIVEHQPKAPGQPGQFGKAHHAGETGQFVLMAAEVVSANPKEWKVVIASGETPYGGYQPMISYRYHGVPLDGPRFVRNVLLWALGYGAEVKGVMEMIKKTPAAAPASVQKEVEALKKTVSELQGKVSGTDAALKEVANAVNKLSSVVQEVAKAASAAESTASSISTIAYASLGVAIVALIAALVAIAAALMRRK